MAKYIAKEETIQKQKVYMAKYLAKEETKVNMAKYLAKEETIQKQKVNMAKYLAKEETVQKQKVKQKEYNAKRKEQNVKYYQARKVKDQMNTSDIEIESGSDDEFDLDSGSECSEENGTDIEDSTERDESQALLLSSDNKKGLWVMSAIGQNVEESSSKSLDLQNFWDEVQTHLRLGCLDETIIFDVKFISREIKDDEFNDIMTVTALKQEWSI